jgi:hypothetical protein
MSFYAGEPVLVNDMVVWSVAGNTVQFSTNSVAYTYTGLTLPFVTPHSGAVKVTVCGRTWSSSATDHSYLTFGLFLTSGLFWAPVDVESFRVYGSNTVRGAVSTLVTGLPPSVAASVSMYLRSDNSSVTANTLSTDLIVRPA